MLFMTNAQLDHFTDDDFLQIGALRMKVDIFKVHHIHLQHSPGHRLRFAEVESRLRHAKSLPRDGLQVTSRLVHAPVRLECGQCHLRVEPRPSRHPQHLRRQPL